MTRLRGFNILPENAASWADEDIEWYLYQLEQQGRLRGRDRAIEILTVQGRYPLPQKNDAQFDLSSATAKEVDTWVDGDKDRAAQALEAELARKTPREGLLTKLRSIT